MNRFIHSSLLIAVYAVVLFMLIFLAVTGSRTVTVISENAPIKNRHCIIIDPGHGGVDGGATSCTGVLESAINLDIACKLEDLLHLLGFKTLMVRKTDISIHTDGESIAEKKVSDLKQRVKIVNETEYAVLVSIHQNYFSDSRYSGAQIFYTDCGESKQLAHDLQAEFVSSLNPGSRRAPQKAHGIYLMDKIHCTGVLIECGFLSNWEEEARLRDDVYQKKICCVIGSVCSRFLKQESLT